MTHSQRAGPRGELPGSRTSSGAPSTTSTSVCGTDDPTRRFLVADEVGLGKTLVARGVIAKTIDHLWETVDRIDVVYICSNGQIARQNLPSSAWV